MESKPDMTVRKAGKKGGETTKAKYGSEFYRRIGKMPRRRRSSKLST